MADIRDSAERFHVSITMTVVVREAECAETRGDPMWGAKIAVHYRRAWVGVPGVQAAPDSLKFQCRRIASATLIQ